MSEQGVAIMGTGQASGESRAQEATEKAIHSPLLEDVDLHDARGILVNVTTGPNLGIREFSDVGAMVREFAANDATVIVGTVSDAEIGDDMRVNRRRDRDSAGNASPDSPSTNVAPRGRARERRIRQLRETRDQSSRRARRRGPAVAGDGRGGGVPQPARVPPPQRELSGCSVDTADTK